MHCIRVAASAGSATGSKSDRRTYRVCLGRSRGFNSACSVVWRWTGRDAPLERRVIRSVQTSWRFIGMALNAPSTSHNSRLQDSMKTSFLQEVFNRELDCWKPPNVLDRRKRRRKHAAAQHRHEGFERTLRASSSSPSASTASTTSSCKRERSSFGARRSRTAACLRTPPRR